MEYRNATGLMLSTCLLLGTSFFPTISLAAEVLSQERAFDCFLTEKSSEKRSLPLSEQTTVSESKVGTKKSDRVDKVLVKEEERGQGFLASNRKTFRVTNYLVDVFKRTTETFGRSSEQERVLTMSTPQYKLIAHCSEERSGTRYVERTRTVSGVRKVEKTVWEEKFVTPPPRTVWEPSYQAIWNRGVVTVQESRTREETRTKISGYRMVQVWVPRQRAWWDIFKEDIKVVMQPIYETYTVSVAYTVPVQQEVWTTEWKFVSLPRVIQDPPVLVRVPRLTLVSEPCTYEEVYHEPRHYSYTAFFDLVLGYERESTSISLSNWEEKGIKREKISSKEEVREGEPYSATSALLVEETKGTGRGISDAVMATEKKTFASNLQIGRTAGKVTYLGASERKALRVDEVLVGDIKRRSSPSPEAKKSKEKDFEYAFDSLIGFLLVAARH
ncbi:MAG TPA: hypothetical protein DD435_02330 [Cyanobacteria bacterium UBA8530]|nr:hypothetical protein [Cyanobacteria bacterium UBA8530]